MERDEKILDYIDGLLSVSEAEQVRARIASDSEWKTQYDSLLEMDTFLKLKELLSPSPAFVNQTIAQLESEMQWSSSKTTTFLNFFQVTIWFWVMWAIVVFTDLNTAMFSFSVQQSLTGLATMSKSGIHLLLGNSAMLWVLGVLLMAYVAVRSYEDDKDLFKEILS